MAQSHDGETLADLLSDPLIRSLMRADHVAPADLEASLSRVAARLQRGGRSVTFARSPRARLPETPTFLPPIPAVRPDVCQTCVGW